MLNDRKKNLLLYHFIVFLYGFTSILGELISLQALPIVIYRMLIGALGLAILLLVINPTHFRVNKKFLKKVFFSGIIIGAHWMTFFYAIKISTISITLSMMSAGALITALIDPIYNRKKISHYEIFFGCITIIGVIIIYRAELQHLIGITIALFSAFLSSLFTILNRTLVRENNFMTLSFYELLIGGVVCLIFYLITNGYKPSDFELKGNDLLWILILGFICTTYAFNVSIKVLRYLSSFTVMMIINLEPIYGIILSILIWKDEAFLSLNFYIGFFIVLSSIYLNSIYNKRRVEKSLK
tara:strand:+ start:7121 stop:8014 length:894 start_codon:yes stop_codon:yes gene_type:complete